MMATVPHVTSGSGLRQFQADGFLLDRVYKICGSVKEAINPDDLTQYGAKRVRLKVQ